MTNGSGVKHIHQTSKDTQMGSVRPPSLEIKRDDTGERLFTKGGNATSRVHYKPSHSPQFSDDENSQEAIQLVPATHTPIRAQRSFMFRAAQVLGIFGSIAWVALCATYLLVEGGLATHSPYELGVFISGILAPIAFYWMLLSYLQRNSDVQYYAQSMRAELHTLFFPSEEDSQHVNKDIEKMTLQAAELATASKAAMKAIARTRQGLRHEIKEFADLARKAEGHLSALSDDVVTKTSDIDAVVETMENRIKTIDDHTQKSITSWDEASARMVERASDIETAMDQGANRILTVADKAEEKSQSISETFDGTITSLGLTVDAVVDRLGSINENFGTYTRTLQISSEELSKESGRLGVMIEDQVEQLQDATGRSVEAISQSLVNMADQKSIFEDSASIITAQAGTIASSMSVAVTELTQATEVIVEKADATETRLSEKASIIATTLNGFTSEIDRIDGLSELASHRLAEGIEVAVSGASQISEAIRRGVENLTQSSSDATTEATSIIEATINHIQHLKDVGQGNMQSIESMVDMLEQGRIQIEKASHAAQTHVDILNRSIETQGAKLEGSALSLADQVKNVTHALEEPLRMVAIAMADADGRHIQIQETLERRVNDLREASAKASDTVETIRHGLREQTQEISSLSGQLMSQSKSINVELNDNKSGLTALIDSGLSDMSRLISGMADASVTIQSSSLSLVDGLNNVANTVETSSNRLNDASNFTMTALSQSSEAFLKTADRLENAVDIANEKITSSSEMAQRASDKMTPLYERIESGAERSSVSLNEFKDTYTEIADITMAKIEKASLQFDDRLVQLESGSNNAASVLKSTSEILRQRLDDIENAASNANDKMKSLSSSMEGQSSDIHIVTDQTSLKIDTIQRLINEQFRELSESVDMAITHIETAGEKFDVRADKMTNNADVIIGRFETAGETAQAKAIELQQASLRVAQTSEKSIATIVSQMHVLNDQSEESLAGLRKTSDSLSIKSREIESMMQSVLNQTKSYVVEMREEVTNVAEKSDHSATLISKSMSKLQHTMGDVDQKTRSVVSFINDTNQSLYDQSGRFVTAVSKSVQAAEHATELFSNQTDNLLKVSRNAVEKTDELQQNELRIGRETFLSSARFVLESLHSLSIDFVRMIDGGVDEKEWQSYQKGDIAMFSTKLAARLGDLPADKIRDKYAEDTEFRNYVQKFMRQFEDVLDQTNTVDRGAVLGTTFAASDVGKIYRYLCNVTGRGDKIAA